MAEDLLKFDRLQATYIDSWKKIGDVKSKANRYEFFVPFIINIVASILISAIITKALGLVSLGGLMSLALSIPTITVSVRRLNAIGKPWPYILINLIPLIGTIIFCLWCAGPDAISSDDAAKENASNDDPSADEIKAAEKEIDSAVGPSDADKEEEEAKAAAAKELDDAVNNNVNDDPLAKAIDEASKNA